jgi:cobalt-zinc-cadmium efflux system outer membrane protein
MQCIRQSRVLRRRWAACAFALATTVATAPAPATAQASALLPRDTVLLGAILDEVQRASPRLTAARSAALAAGARVSGAKRPPDPQVQIGWMNYDLASLRPMDGIGMTQLQVMQMLPLAGKLRIAGEIETERASAAATRVAEVSFDLRARAAMVFYDILAADGALAVARDTKRLLQDIASIAASMYQVGDGRQTDVLRANVEVARMQEEIIRMEAMRVGMSARINALRDAPGDTPVGAPKLPRFASVVPPLDSLNLLAGQQRPMLAAAAREVNAADAALRLAQLEIWPDLQLGVQYGQRPGPDGTERMASLMIGASIPVFRNQRQYPMREEANAMHAMAAADLATMRAETRGALGEAHASLLRARRLAELYRTSVLPQAEATVNSSLASYRVGTVNFMTLLDAQMTLNRFRQELFTLEADEGKAWAELEMLTGRVFVDAYTAQPARPAGGPPR